MAAPVYSTRFIAVQGLSGTGGSVTVPSGFVYVVKQITFYMASTFGPMTAFLEDDASGAALFSGKVNPGTPEWFGFFGQLVFESGQAFHMQVDAVPGDSADVYCGGYALES